MASLMVEIFSKPFKNINYKSPLFYSIVRYTAKSPRIKQKRGTIKHRNLIQSSCDSLAARGFLRSYKPYTPTENVTDVVKGICQKILGTKYDLEAALSREDKFNLLNTCYKELNYSIPNSLLYKIVNVTDVIKFYETQVSTTNPYYELQNQNLPPNLHIQYDYLRFHPDTDTMFKGVSAFPKSSTIITDIKCKEKYKGYKAPSPYLDNEVVFDKEN